MTTTDLVVGAAFPEHAFQPGHAAVVLDGATAPWNTLALWHAPTLALVGFLGCAEGLAAEGLAAAPSACPADARALGGGAPVSGPPSGAGVMDGGVEEVSAVAVLQHLGAARRRASLVRVPGLAWAVAGAVAADPARAAWQARKMASKVARPAAQLARLPHLPPGRVRHVDLVGGP